MSSRKSTRSTKSPQLTHIASVADSTSRRNSSSSTRKSPSRSERSEQLTQGRPHADPSHVRVHVEDDDFNEIDEELFQAITQRNAQLNNGSLQNTSSGASRNQTLRAANPFATARDHTDFSPLSHSDHPRWRPQRGVPHGMFRLHYPGEFDKYTGQRIFHIKRQSDFPDLSKEQIAHVTEICNVEQDSVTAISILGIIGTNSEGRVYTTMGLPRDTYRHLARYNHKLA